MSFLPIPDILEELKAGKPIVLVDDEDRENEGDLVYAAEKITPAAMNFILVHGRGTVCLSLTGEQCDKLRLHPQTDLNTSALGTAFTVTVDAHPRFGVSTGVSARDRATTVQVAVALPGRSAQIASSSACAAALAARLAIAVTRLNHRIGRRVRCAIAGVQS